MRIRIELGGNGHKPPGQKTPWTKAPPDKNPHGQKSPGQKCPRTKDPQGKSPQAKAPGQKSPRPRTPNKPTTYSIAAVAGNRTILVFKMLLLRQFLTELDDTLTQCSPTWSVYMVLTDSRYGSYNVTDDVITYNHCRNFRAKYLGNDAT